MIDKAPTTIIDYLLEHGGLGVAILVLICVVIFLWREFKSTIKKSEDDIVAERNRSTIELSNERDRHAKEIAAERRLNAEIQEQRISELRIAVEAIKSVTATVESALSVLRGRN